ncbi:hypothetical protein BRD18_05285 [Halobacteriales archaeon SW_7_71_33]|nr:MAG: hypothetical protein BRD18_05285 [Halobacteriales archaeon SW_7_71_33]
MQSDCDRPQAADWSAVPSGPARSASVSNAPPVPVSTTERSVVDEVVGGRLEGGNHRAVRRVVPVGAVHHDPADAVRALDAGGPVGVRRHAPECARDRAEA